MADSAPRVTPQRVASLPAGAAHHAHIHLTHPHRAAAFKKAKSLQSRAFKSTEITLGDIVGTSVDAPPPHDAGAVVVSPRASVDSPAKEADEARSQPLSASYPTQSTSSPPRNRAGSHTATTPSQGITSSVQTKQSTSITSVDDPLTISSILSSSPHRASTGSASQVKPSALTQSLETSLNSASPTASTPAHRASTGGLPGQGKPRTRSIQPPAPLVLVSPNLTTATYQAQAQTSKAASASSALQEAVPASSKQQTTIRSAITSSKSMPTPPSRQDSAAANQTPDGSYTSPAKRTSNTAQSLAERAPPPHVAPYSSSVEEDDQPSHTGKHGVLAPEPVRLTEPSSSSESLKEFLANVASIPLIEAHQITASDSDDEEGNSDESTLDNTMHTQTSTATIDNTDIHVTVATPHNTPQPSLPPIPMPRSQSGHRLRRMVNIFIPRANTASKSSLQGSKSGKKDEDDAYTSENIRMHSISIIGMYGCMYVTQ